MSHGAGIPHTHGHAGTSHHGGAALDLRRARAERPKRSARSSASTRRRPTRWATAAASVRERTSSLERIRETWTDAVFSAMYRAAPISRFVLPFARSASTWRSRGVSPNGSSPASVAAPCADAGEGSSGSSRSRARSAKPSTSDGEPARADLLRGGERGAGACRPPLRARRRPAAPRPGGASPARRGRGARAPARPARPRPTARGRRDPARGRARRGRVARNAASTGRSPSAHASTRAISPSAVADRERRVLPQVARPHRGVGLDAHAGRGHARHARDVLRAEVEPVERVVDRLRGRRRGRPCGARAPRAASRAGRSTAARGCRRRRRTPGRAACARALVLAAAERELDPPQRVVDERRALRGAARGRQRGLGRRPVARLERELGAHQHQPAPRQALGGGDLVALGGDLARLGQAAGGGQRVGVVDVGVRVVHQALVARPLVGLAQELLALLVAAEPEQRDAGGVQRAQLGRPCRRRRWRPRAPPRRPRSPRRGATRASAPWPGWRAASRGSGSGSSGSRSSALAARLGGGRGPALAELLARRPAPSRSAERAGSRSPSSASAARR